MERRKVISKKLDDAGLDYEFFEGVDGNQLAPDFLGKIQSAALKYPRDNPGKMLPGEIGVASSHLNVYKKIKDEKIDIALIIEDDIDFDQKLVQLINNKSKTLKGIGDYELILLGYCVTDLNYKKPALCSYWGRKELEGVCRIGAPILWYWAAIGYLMKYDAALKLLSLGDFPLVQADYLTANSPAYGVKLGVAMNPIIWPGHLNEDSTIGDRTFKNINPGLPGSMLKPDHKRFLSKFRDFLPMKDLYHALKKKYIKLNKRANLFYLKISLVKYHFVNKEPL